MHLSPGQKVRQNLGRLEWVQFLAGSSTGRMLLGTHVSTQTPLSSVPICEGVTQSWRSSGQSSDNVMRVPKTDTLQ